METKPKSKAVALIFLIPSLILGIISAIMAYIGLGLIPVLPAVIGLLLGIISLRLFKTSFQGFAKTVIVISLLAALVSLFRGLVIKETVATDTEFDSTVVKTQEGINTDLDDAFGDAFASEEKDSVASK